MKNKLFDVVCVICAALLALLIWSLISRSKVADIADQNIRAAADTLAQYKLKNGELLASIASYEVASKDMAGVLRLTEDQLKEYKKKLGSKPQVVTKIQTRVSHDTIVITSPIEKKDEFFTARLAYKDKYTSLGGSVTGSQDTIVTTIDDLNIDVPLTVGLTKDKQFFASSTNPDVYISSITPVIDKTMFKKPSHWGVGVQAGFGGVYGIKHKKFDYGPYVGLGVSYKLF